MNIACTDFSIEIRVVPIPQEDGTMGQGKLLVMTDAESGTTFVFGPLNESGLDALHRGTSPIALPPNVQMPSAQSGRPEGEESG